MSSVSALISRRLGSSPVEDEKPAPSHTLKWIPVIEKSPDCRPKLRTGLWGEIEGRVVVTVEETGEGWKWYFSPGHTLPSGESFGYAPTRDTARDTAEGKWTRLHKPKKWSAPKKTEATYANVLLSFALQAVFYLGLMLLGAVALAYVVLPLQSGAVQTMRNLARHFGG